MRYERMKTNTTRKRASLELGQRDAWLFGSRCPDSDPKALVSLSALKIVWLDAAVRVPCSFRTTVGMV